MQSIDYLKAVGVAIAVMLITPFAAASSVLYVVIDFGMLPALGVELSAVLTWTMAFWLGVKYLGASLGAWLGQRGGARS